MGNRVIDRLTKRKEDKSVEIQVIRPNMKCQNTKKVCAYCRVSTETEEQENSLENQISYYKDYITSIPQYEYVGVYHDFGISGFKESRPGFQEMMQAARAGKIELIITKSISRFARNTVTVLNAVRELKELGVGIFFELQNINTMTEAGELLLTVIAACAQAESETYRNLAKQVYQRKYESGIPVQYLERSFGYTKNEKGEVLPDKVEAEWVKKMYHMIADGYHTADVKRYLNGCGVKTVQGAEFTESTVIRIIENVIYQGDFIMHKHFVNADRRIVKNTGQVDAWYVKEDHPPIVSSKLWQKAQEAIARKREYLANGSIVEELTEEYYPYRNQLYCAKCGFSLYRRIYSNRNRVSWECSGHKRYLKKFCSGISIPDGEVRSWGSISGNVYIEKETDALGKKIFRYEKERTWKRKNQRKVHEELTIPELSEENYPYYKKIYCVSCGERLARLKLGNGSVVWICNGWKRKGKCYCEGIRLPDQLIRSWGEITTDIYIEEREDNDGKKHYGYTCKTGSNKGWQS